MSDGNAVKWGIISTAHINRHLIPAAHASSKVELVGVASRDAARAEAYAREWEIPRSYGSYEELLADPEIEAVYISLPNTMHCEWSIRARRGREARALREADVAPSRGGRGGVRRRRALRADPVRGVHVAPQPADGEARLAGRRRRDRRASARAVDVQLLALRHGEHPAADGSRGWRVDGCRLLLRQRFAAARRRTGVRVRGGTSGRHGNGLGVRGDDALSGRRAGAVRLRHGAAQPRRARGDRERRIPLPRRPVACADTGDRAAPQ